MSYRYIGIHVQSHHIHIFLRRFIYSLPIDKPSFCKSFQFVKADIFGNTAVRDQIDLLIYNTDMVPDRVIIAVKMKHFAIQDNLALIRSINTAYYFHKGTFPGSVFSQDGIDLAFFESYGYVLKSLYAGERFRNIFQFKHILSSKRCRETFPSAACSL